MPVFLDDLIDPFYQRLGADFRRSVARGQIFRIHVGYTRENLEVWRPTNYDESQTSASQFRQLAAPGDAFARTAPLHTPRLETNEEFLVVRAKRRPVIMLSPTPPAPEVPRMRGGGRIHRPLALVVPIYSLANRHTGEPKYPAVFIERLRTLAYPEFLYLPPLPGVLHTPSYARVSELQAIVQPHLDATDGRLSDTSLAVLQAQILYLTTGRYEAPLHTYREELLHQEGAAGV